MRHLSKAWWIKEVIFTWPSVAWGGVIILVIILAINKFKISSIRGGSFAIELSQKASERNIVETDAFKALRNLNEEELKQFLIMGGEDAKFYVFTNTRLSNEASLTIYRNLQKDSLIRISRVNKDPNRNDSTMIFPTEIGSKVHRVLIQTLYSELMK